MISRLTAIAATFAIFATASLAFAAGTHQSGASSSVVAAHQTVRVVQLERVVITAKRSHTAN